MTLRAGYGLHKQHNTKGVAGLGTRGQTGHPGPSTINGSGIRPAVKQTRIPKGLGHDEDSKS